MAPFVLLAILLAACGGTGVEEFPTVEITRLDAEGTRAILEYVVGDDSGTVSVTIDWGDGSTPESFSASGELAATHDYPVGLTEVVVGVTAVDADDQETRTSQILTFHPTSTTTSTTSSSTTTTTAAATTTTTAATTTTARAPTTTAATTTTLPPEAMEQVYELAVRNADIVDELISPRGANGSAAPSGGRVVVFAETFGSEGEIDARSSIGWIIPEEEWRLLGPEPLLSLVMEYQYTVSLRTGPNPGRAAAFDFSVYAENNGGLLVEPRRVTETIGAGDEFDDGQVNRMGFGTTLPSDATGPIVIMVETGCNVEPGTTIFQIGESSRCAGDLLPDIRVTLTRNDSS